MSLIQIQNVSFAYPGAAQPVFEDVTLNLDTAWRLGLVGRNGRGKTTLLRLLLGELRGSGKIISSRAFSYFPVHPADEGQSALGAARDVIAPFDVWEAEMERLAGQSTPEAMARYGDIQQRYAEADGYTINEQIAAECGRLGIGAEALRRPFGTLSGGEQVKLLLGAMFLKKHNFLLIDEPTDHLDAAGRTAVAKWLAGKSGFIVVSHDRTFLDGAINHVLSINKADIELQKGNYSSWRQNRTRQDEHEKAENQKLASSIRRLQQAAKRTERWSENIEKSKNAGKRAAWDRDAAVPDRGYVGHQAARMMQRSKAIEKRRQREVAQKQTLLKNVEEAEPLKFQLLKPPKSRLVSAEGIALRYGSRTLFQNLSFAVSEGERIAVQGPNGSGKTSLLQLVTGGLTPSEGTLRRAGGLVVSWLPQNTDGLQGMLADFAQRHALPQSLFLALLRKLDFPRAAFTQPMQSYSAGQRKKVYLAASLAAGAHLFVWDEPLNYVDVHSREQIEQAVLLCQPTMLFVEHDTAFVDAVATRRIQL